MAEKVWRAKEYLVSLGILKKEGRGRMSQEAHDALEHALAEGIQFSNYPKSDVTVQTKTGTKTVKKVSTAPAEIGDVTYIYPEHAFKAVQANGKVRSMREICRPCGFSLVVCTCAYYSRTPRIVSLDGRGDVDVSIERK